jgi:hypothetical protein
MPDDTECGRDREYMITLWIKIVVMNRKNTTSISMLKNHQLKKKSAQNGA